MERKANILIHPGFRVRDLIRVTAVVDHVCRVCGNRELFDVVGAACRFGPSQGMTQAVNACACSRCGRKDGNDWESVPSMLRYAARLGDILEDRARLDASCGACRRTWTVPALEVGRQHGADARLAEIGPRLTCPHCGRAGWATVRAAPVR